MFGLALIFFAMPATLVALLVVAAGTKWLRLLPAGMAFGWLVVPTVGLAAGGTMLALTVEELVIRPIQLQDELLGHQLVTPLSLREYQFSGGFGDSGWRWLYAIDPDRAAQLRRSGCRQEPAFPAFCLLGGGSDPANGGSARVTLDGASVTIEDEYW